MATLAGDAAVLVRADAPYTRLGDWVGWLCLAGFAASIVLMPLAGQR